LFGQPEIEQLDALLGYENIGRFQIPMSYAFLVRGIQSVQNQSGVLNGFVERQRSFEGSAFDQFHDKVVRSDIVKLADVWMIQGCDGSGLTLEPFRELLLRNFDCDFTAQTSIGGSIHFAHAALT
jgi:hypothetical protein